MPTGPKGLTTVPTDDLRKLLSAVHRRVIPCPLTIEGLTRIGLQQRASELLATLRRLDEPAVRTVLVVAIAERSA